ncbi:MAG: thiolase family protein [Pseudomonadota bacterium]|nr:thiolase family protein [Pseudomonadota bacterium]
MNKGYEGVYIVGAGQAVYRKGATDPVHRILWEAMNNGLLSASLDWKQVDGLAVSAFVLPPDNVTVVAEHFGLAPRWLFQGLYGGASGVIGMLHAARAIQAGDADVVACVTADVFDTARHNELLDQFNSSMRDYLSPFGFGGANGTFALHTRLYMDRYGATREDFGKLCVAQRANALLNPNALFDKALTLDDYLNARVIAEPLHLFDCVMPCTGGDCVVLASERVAESLTGPLVRILGGGEWHNYPKDDIYSLTGGWEAFRDRMYDQAGCGPQDMDFAQLYDDYPVMEFIQLEGLGITGVGETAQFIRNTDTTVNGTFPINTGGGQLSAGQAGASGGMIGVVEGVLQLRGEAGERQVDCHKGIVSGYGLVAYGRGLSCSAAVLERA